MTGDTRFDRPAEDYPPLATAVFGLVGLMTVCFFSFLDRQMFNLLVEPIRNDLQIDDTQIGILQGIAFALSYSVMALPFGWMADRYNRTRLVISGLVVWSVATFCLGFSENFSQMLIARMLIGGAEAALMPAAYSLLADYFPPHQRGRVFAAYMSAVFLGGGGSLIAGGFLLGLLGGVDSLSVPLLGLLPVWRAAFVAVSIPGLVTALPLLLFLREPPRRSIGTAGAPSPRSSGMTSYIRQHRAAFFTIFVVYSLFGITAQAVQAWAPTLLIRNYGLQPASAGVVVGLGVLLPALIGSFIAGVLGDRWIRQRRRGGRLPLIYPFWIINFPALLMFGFSVDVRFAVAGFALHGLVMGIALSSSSAVVQDMVPSHLRGRAIASWYLITGIVGNGFGPAIAGGVNDHVFRSELALPYTINVIAGPCLLAGLILTVAGTAAYDRACGRSEPAGSQSKFAKGYRHA